MVALGVPGVAFGVFFLLLRQFGFSFSTIGPVASAAIAILFLLIVGGVTFYTIHRWSPQMIKEKSTTKSTTEQESMKPKDKERQRELEQKGHKGATNSELHILNVKENRSKSYEELMRIVEEKEKIHGFGWAKKARAELRRRGYDY